MRSPDFEEGATLSDRHAKQGGNAPPPLEWSGVPDGTRELAVVVEDPDAPSGRFVHWLVSGLAPEVDRLSGQLPEGAVEGRNDFGDVGYGGPQPPEGDTPHRYVFTVLALDDAVGLSPGADAREFHDAVQGKELARGRLTGRYGR